MQKYIVLESNNYGGVFDGAFVRDEEVPSTLEEAVSRAFDHAVKFYESIGHAGTIAVTKKQVAGIEMTGFIVNGQKFFETAPHKGDES